MGPDPIEMKMKHQMKEEFAKGVSTLTLKLTSLKKVLL